MDPLRVAKRDWRAAVESGLLTRLKSGDVFSALQSQPQQSTQTHELSIGLLYRATHFLAGILSVGAEAGNIYALAWLSN
jgi:hypothetical protein